jgi:hypothetical protein
MKAWTALMFSAALAIAGALPVVCFVAVMAWQIVTLFQTRAWAPMPATLLMPETLLPAHPAAMWVLDRLHAGVVPALLGLAIAAVGVRGVLRQRAAMRTQRQRTQDRLRRVDDYRRDDAANDTLDGRREPFIARM